MITPPYLNPGDKVAIVAPAGKLGSDQLNACKQLLADNGLQPVLAKHVFDEDGYFAGTDESRRADIQSALDDQGIRAILCARGGYGTTRVLDQLDFTKFNKSPKWVVGFSDITALHIKLSLLGVESIHGPMGQSFERPESKSSVEGLVELLMGEELNYTGANPLHSGETSGELIGGNLAIVCDSLGTSTEINTDNKILFLEEVGEPLYRIDRMMVQLKRAGKLDGIKGLVLGDFSDITETKVPFGHSLEDIMLGVCVGLEIPIAAGFSIGHDLPNYAIVCGREYELIVEQDMASLKPL